jgi:hypothetical protein
MNSYEKIHYSLGKNKYDNQPLQMISNNFDSFEKTLLSTRSLNKGEIFFTSGFSLGVHSEPEKYPAKSHYRLKRLAQPRRFMPFDFDWFASPSAYTNLVKLLEVYRGFGYETWSHTPQAPRARAVLELSRLVSADESVRIGIFLENEIAEAIGCGLVKFDKSVYQLEQPIYVAPKNAKDYIFGGTVLDVDNKLSQYRHEILDLSMPLKKPKHLKAARPTCSLTGKFPPPDESPRQITWLKGMLSFIDADCDYEVYRRVVWAILSTGWDCAEEIAYDWSITAPNRFDQRVLDYLISGFDPDLPNHPTLGSIKFLAEDGGWHE